MAGPARRKRNAERHRQVAELAKVMCRLDGKDPVELVEVPPGPWVRLGDAPRPQRRENWKAYKRQALRSLVKNAWGKP